MTYNILLLVRPPIFRRGLADALREKQFNVLGDYSSASDYLGLTSMNQPDAVIVQLETGPGDNMKLIQELHARHPDAKLVVLGSERGPVQEEINWESLMAGVRGFIAVDADEEDAIESLFNVLKGRYALPPSLVERLVNEQVTAEEHETVPSRTNKPLTPRETDVLQMVGLGHGNRHIADALGLSESTVASHVGSILAKLRAPNRTQAAVQAAQLGLIRPDESVGDQAASFGR